MEKLSHLANSRFKERGKFTDSRTPKLRKEALVQVTKGWVEGPLKFTDKGRLLVDGAESLVSPAYPFGSQQSDKLRAPDGPSREA